MSLFDLLMTLTYLTQAGMMESNPIARVVMVGGGVPAVIGWKVLTVMLAVFLLYKARRRLSGELGVLLCCTVLGWLMVRWHTYTAEAHSMTTVLNADETIHAFDWVSLADEPVTGRPTRVDRVVLRSEAWDEP